uniref:Uncharacterized protein n=1 Tax=Arundo donax TaxID=35708 RepID=A0A0A8YFL7_ARUDO
MAAATLVANFGHFFSFCLRYDCHVTTKLWGMCACACATSAVVYQTIFATVKFM